MAQTTHPQKQNDIRSRNCVFVAHCVLAQCVRAVGISKNFPAIIKPVVEFCAEHEINIFQMPCPELLCEAGGFGRTSHGKVWYEKHGMRGLAQKLAKEQVAYMKGFVDNGFKIKAIIGIDFSPACAVNYINRGPVIIKERGIFIEELAAELKRAKLKIPFIGINERAPKKLAKELAALL